MTNIDSQTPLIVLLELYSPDNWMFFYDAAIILLGLEIGQNKESLYQGKQSELLKNRSDGKTLITILEEIYDNHSDFKGQIQNMFSHMLKKELIERANISDNIRNDMGLVDPQPQN